MHFTNIPYHQVQFNLNKCRFLTLFFQGCSFILYNYSQDFIKIIEKYSKNQEERYIYNEKSQKNREQIILILFQNLDDDIMVLQIFVMGAKFSGKPMFKNYIKPSFKETSQNKPETHSFLQDLEPAPIYQFSTGKQLPGISNPIYPTPKTLTVLTYNIWFESYNVQNRNKCILSLLEDSQADFICLQEVTSTFMQLLHAQGKNSWLKGYFMAVIPMNWYDTVILSKFHCRFYKRNFKGSHMQRSMLLAEMFVEGGENVVVGSMHYESLDSTKQRIEQMEEVYSVTAKAPVVIIAGDYNFTDGMPENQHVPKEFKDVWKECHDSLEGSETMPKTPKFSAWRPDHILCRTPFPIKGAKITKVGEFTIEPHESQNVKDIQKDGIVRTPSDHFGLFALIPFSFNRNNQNN